MIDSILLKIPICREKIDLSRFTRVRTQSTRGKPRVIRYSLDKTNQNKKEGIYVPQIYIEERMDGLLQKHVCIQVSLPKLIYGGTNLFEVDESSMGAILESLQAHLERVGIVFTKDRLMLARIHRIDFAKIIKLPKGNSAMAFIAKLQKSGYRPRTDLTERDVRSGRDGYWIKFYNSSSSLTIYDKTMEVLKQGYTKNEEQLKSLIKLGKLKNNILRYEVSLQTPQKVLQILNSITHLKKKAYSFAEVFKQELSQQVQLLYLNAYFNADLDFLCHYFSSRDVRAHIRNLFGYKRSQIALYFIIEEVRERGQQIVFDEIRLLNGYAARKRIEKDVQSLAASIAVAQQKNLNPVTFLKGALDKFKLFNPIKLA